MMIIALGGSMLGALGQDTSLIAAAEGRPMDTLMEGHAAAAASSPRSADVPITDDGHAGDELVSVRQLVIAFRMPGTQPFSVDILNERGHCVRTYAFAQEARGKAVPVSLEGLTEGRYVARVAMDGGVRMVRFQR